MADDSISRESHPLAARPDEGTTGRAAGDAASSPDAFHSTVELTATGISHIDLAGRFIYVNPALCRILGYSREQLLSLTFQDITHPEDVAEIVHEFRRLIVGEVPACRMEKRYFRQDGSVVWVDLNVTLRRTPSGAPQYVIAIVDDISERKRLQDELRAANRRLALAVEESQQQANDIAATFEAITDVIIVFDEAGRVRRANKAARDFIVPYQTIEEGRQHLDIASVQGQPFTPDQWPSARVLRGEPLTGPYAVDMLAHIDGGPEALFNISGAPVRDSQGQIVGGVLVMRDVTERRQLEQHTRDALQALLQMAEALVAPASAPVRAPASLLGADAAASTAPKFNLVAQRLAELAKHVLGCERVSIIVLAADQDTMHPVALTGLTPERAQAWFTALDGQRMSEYIGADNVQRLKAGEVAQFDLERQPLAGLAQGGPVAMGVPLRLGGQLVGGLALGYEQAPQTYTEDELALAEAVGQMAALVIERDRLLEEREAARANTLALQEANRRMEEFLGIASHELRTPLASLLGNLQLMQRRLARASGGGKTAEDLARQLHMVDTLLEPMTRQGKRLSRLVGDLVNTSRIQTGKLDFHMQPSDLTAIVREVVEEQRQAQPERIIDLAQPDDDALVSVIADADRVEQVVTNYLTNALKYSSENQPVEVRLQVDGDTARVSVRDHGPGLPRKEQARIWDVFHRAPGINVQSGSGIGLGLGLHISKTIVERHGGQVGVESAVGRGSTFWFTLPLSTPSQTPPTTFEHKHSSIIAE